MSHGRNVHVLASFSPPYWYPKLVKMVRKMTHTLYWRNMWGASLRCHTAVTQARAY